MFLPIIDRNYHGNGHEVSSNAFDVLLAELAYAMTRTKTSSSDFWCAWSAVRITEVIKSP